MGSHCVDCVRRARPAKREQIRYWNAARHDLVTRSLVAVNVVVYLWVLSGRLVPTNLGVINDHELRLGLSKSFIDAGEWYRLVSCGFLHFGLLHVGMNMLLLWQLGQILEPALGRGKYALLYLSALIGGSAGALLLSPDALTGGASGAVFGLMAAAAVGLQQRGVNPLRTGIGATLVLNLLITFAIPGISIGGHLGGAIVGAGVGYAMLEPRWNRTTPWAGWAAPAIAIIFSVALVAALP